jgi:hypothetical protein
MNTQLDPRIDMKLAACAVNGGNLEATAVTEDTAIFTFASAPERTFRVALDEYGEAVLSELVAKDTQPGYEQALKIVDDFTEGLSGTVGFTRSGSPCDDLANADYIACPEYTRGQLELLCDMFPGENR